MTAASLFTAVWLWAAAPPEPCVFLALGEDARAEALVPALEVEGARALASSKLCAPRPLEALFAPAETSALEAGTPGIRALPSSPVETAEARLQPLVRELDALGAKYRDRVYKDVWPRTGPLIDALRVEGNFVRIQPLLCRAYALRAGAAKGLNKPKAEVEGALRLHLALCSKEALRADAGAQAETLLAMREILELRGGAEAAPGTLEVETVPPGMTVFLDGKARGTSPLELRDIAPGPHVVRVERIGFEPRGQVVELYAKHQRVHLEPVPLPGFSAWAHEKPEVFSALVNGQSSAAFLAARKVLGVPRAIIALVHAPDAKGAVKLELFDVPLGADRPRATKTLVLQAGDVAHAAQEMLAVLPGLFRAGDASQRAAPVSKKRKSDPLESRSGEEEWSTGARTPAVDAPSSDSKKKKAKSKDPLEGRSGTEDW